ncbi:hypothetical protein [Paracoccus sp. (in: a-proteobacteria)]|uniref:hypothetical protein n=1 Tax=Paracoccus sp. TaxID=267 RepID=UPI0028A6324F|nr:hypothetical protein [Paracoccus sp. (in: a-proteobacteria)]
MNAQTKPLEAENLPATVEIDLPALTNAEEFFRDDDAVSAAINKIRAAVRSHVPDVTTRKGRDAIASLAYRVSKSKTYLDGEGKKLVEGIKKQASSIDASRKKIRDDLDALRDEARKPLDEWEAAEAERQERDAVIVRQIAQHGLTGFEPSADIVAKAHQIKAITLPPDFTGDRDAIEAKRTETMQALRNMFDTALQREKDAAELARLRAEEEARAAKEAEEKAAREQAEREAQRDRERAEAAELARQEAEARAAEEIERTKRDAAEAVERAQREAQEAIERERQAQADREAEAERQRQEEAARVKREAEEAAKAEADAKAKREASEQRRGEVQADIETALEKMAGKATPAAIALALMAGEIPHCKVEV